MKKLYLVMVIALALVLGACSQPATEEKKPDTTVVETTEKPAEGETAELELTLEELKDYNGKDGKPAYVAVDGVIYDVTEIGAWKDGEHNGVMAGTDATKEIKEKSPHGVSKLEKLPVVGKIVEK